MSEGSTTAFVGALDNSVTEQQLAEVFAAYGQITCVKIPYGKNCAFVEYTHPSSVVAAIAALNGTTLGNGRIRVIMGINKGERARSGIRTSGAPVHRPYMPPPHGGGYGAPPQAGEYYSSYSTGGGQPAASSWQQTSYHAAAPVASTPYGSTPYASGAPYAPYGTAAPSSIVPATDPDAIYTQDQDVDETATTTPTTTNQPTPINDQQKANNTYANTHLDIHTMRLGWQLQTIDYPATLIGRY